MTQCPKCCSRNSLWAMRDKFGPYVRCTCCGYHLDPLADPALTLLKYDHPARVAKQPDSSGVPLNPRRLAR